MNIYLLLDIIITGIAFLIYPFFKFFRNDHKYTIAERKKTILINSVVVQIIFVVILLSINESYKPNFLPALLYYYINSSLWIKEKKDYMVEKSFDNDERAKIKAEYKKEKAMDRKYIIGLILVIVELIALFCAIGYQMLPDNIFSLIGFLFPGAIGIYLFLDNN